MATVLATLALTLLAVNFVSIVIAGIRLSRRDKSGSIVIAPCAVSIVIPVRGIEAYTDLTLSRAFALDWPEYELVFCAADALDPIVPEIRRAIDEHPGVPARLLIGDDRISANPKLNNCAKGWNAARHEWVILADSNVLMPRNYIQHLVSAWRKDTGLVCSTPIGSRPHGFWAEVECAFLNTLQARWQYAGETLGFGFAQGKSMLWHKPFLESVGGIQALAAEIAEDAAATKLVNGRGKRVHLVSSPFEQPLGKRSLDEIWSRQGRWARLRRVTFPLFFAPEILLGAIPPLTCALVAAALMDYNLPIVALIVVTGVYLPEMALAAAKGWRVSIMSLPAMMARDVLLPAIWVRSWMSGSFVWRGNTMTIGTHESQVSRSSAM